jgi:hypothetical protein
VQFVMINVKIIRKLISTFGKAHSKLSSTIILFRMTESSFCCTKLMSNIYMSETAEISYCSSHLDKHQLVLDNNLSTLYYLQ